ncbi:hydantoinase B/oxoprolinase family protein [candidate division KSB1 bacterium]
MVKTRKDPVKLEIYKNRFQSVAEEMGAALQRTAFSPNIKERRDFSCAVFDGTGKMVAQAEHIPVHLGAMPLSVESMVRKVGLKRGDTGILNDPFEGGTHLPDITMVRPVYLKNSNSPSFYVANRAHHSDVGGMTPGSMPLSREVFQEGIRIPPLKFEHDHEIDRSVLLLLLANVRTPHEREGDLLAQYMSAKVGEERLLELVDEFGFEEVFSYMDELQRYAERMMRAVIKRIPDGEYSFSDYMDDDGQSDRPVRISVRITVSGDSAVLDFSGSDAQVSGCVNSVYAITLSAAYYVFRTLVGFSIPSNSGCLAPVTVIAPEGTVVNARFPAAVTGGNVETSQRTVDVLYGALAKAIPEKIPAASGGTMNNLTMGGVHPETQQPFAYYETIGCGMGARPMKPGMSGVHTHMTNTLNTPVEVIEHELPVRILRYGFRKNSGGKGAFCGGDGIEKSIEFLSDASVSLIADRRKTAPYGLAGGLPGRSGRDTLRRGRKTVTLGSKFNISVTKGSVFTIKTPGGGGFGPPF